MSNNETGTHDYAHIEDSLVCTFREVVSSGAVLSNVKILFDLMPRTKSEHGVVIESIVSEQQQASWLEHLETKVGRARRRDERVNSRADKRLTEWHT